MKRFFLLSVLIAGFFLGLTAGAEETAPSEGAIGTTCDEEKPHPSANYCLAQEPATGQQQKCCLNVCLSCHSSPSDDPNLAGPTEWNSREQIIAYVYTTLASTEPNGLADLCIDCHNDRFMANLNHPVEIVYQGGEANIKLKANPEGVKLVCAADAAQNGEGCMLRCVTCHKLHPVESEGNQAHTLLRVNNAGSALCIRCHDR